MPNPDPAPVADDTPVAERTMRLDSEHPSPAADSEEVGSSSAGAGGQDDVIELEPQEPQTLEPYVFDPAHLDAAAAMFDEAFADLHDGAHGWSSIKDAAGRRDTDLENPLVRELARAASYHLDLDGDDAGCELAVHGGFWLPDVDDVDPDVVSLWRALAQAVSAPAAIARLEDLLVARRDGKVGHRARRAAAGYLAAVGDRGDTMITTTFLVRAWTLCRRYKLAENESAVLDEIERRVDDIAPGHPGVQLPLLEVMCKPPLDASRADALRAHAAATLERVAVREGRPWLAERISRLRRRVIDPGVDGAEARRGIFADRLAALRRAADVRGHHPSVRMFHLETAAQFALKHGMGAELAEITSQMQGIDVSELNLARIQVRGALPPWVPEAYLRDYTAGPTFELGLARFLTAPVPSGELSELEAYADSQRGGLGRFLPPALLDRHGLPRQRMDSEEGQAAVDMAFCGRITAENHGRLLAEGLRRVGDRYQPTVEEVTEFLVLQYSCDPGAARTLAKGLAFYWGGENEVAAHLVIPAAEAAARRLLLELDAGIYRVAADGRPGGFPEFRALLTALDDLALDPSWAWFLQWLFLGPVGANLRNEVAHGFVTYLDPVYGALMLRAAAVLITASPVDDVQGRRVEVLRGPAVQDDRTIRGRLLRRTGQLLQRGYLATLAMQQRLAEHRREGPG